MPKRSMIRKASAAVAALTATVIVAGCGGSPQARSITVTFVRHAQSESNASGTIDTDVPGPGLTPEGKGQAEQVAHQLGRKDYDSVYASTMTQGAATAAPLAAELGKQVEAARRPGDRRWLVRRQTRFDGVLRRTCGTGGLDQGDVSNSIPGSISGKEFNDQSPRPSTRSTTAGHHDAVVFSRQELDHGVDADERPQRQGRLIDTHPLPTTGRVVISGSDDPLDAGRFGRQRRLPRLSRTSLEDRQLTRAAASRDHVFMRYVVTGGTGFIGRRVVSRLFEPGPTRGCGCWCVGARWAASNGSRPRGASG